ncbi:unnamed protein product, partial [Protopolystoma xenopodis]
GYSFARLFGLSAAETTFALTRHYFHYYHTDSPGLLHQRQLAYFLGELRLLAQPHDIIITTASTEPNQSILLQCNQIGKSNLDRNKTVTSSFDQTYLSDRCHGITTAQHNLQRFEPPILLLSPVFRLSLEVQSFAPAIWNGLLPVSTALQSSFGLGSGLTLVVSTDVGPTISLVNNSQMQQQRNSLQELLRTIHLSRSPPHSITYSWSGEWILRQLHSSTRGPLPSNQLADISARPNRSSLMPVASYDSEDKTPIRFTCGISDNCHDGDEEEENGCNILEDKEVTKGTTNLKLENLTEADSKSGESRDNTRNSIKEIEMKDTEKVKRLTMMPMYLPAFLLHSCMFRVSFLLHLLIV